MSCAPEGRKESDEASLAMLFGCTVAGVAHELIKSFFLVQKRRAGDKAEASWFCRKAREGRAEEKEVERREGKMWRASFGVFGSVGGELRNVCASLR